MQAPPVVATSDLDEGFRGVNWALLVGSVPRKAGMERSLRLLGPFFVRLERVLATYGLDFDAALAGMRISLAEQTGDTARVRLQYTLAGQPIDALALMERRDGRWYLSDLLRRAEAEATVANATSAAP